MSRQVRWDAEPVQPSAAVRRRRLVHPSPRPWRYAGRALEHAVQMALIGKAATEGDRGERHVGRDEQLLGGFDPLHLQPAMRRQTERCLEGAGEMRHRQVAFGGDGGERRFAGEIGRDQIASATLLPRREAAAEMPRSSKWMI